MLVASRSHPPGPGPAPIRHYVSTPPGLIQQAAVWNIAALTEQNLNFGPIYITSGEDVSLSRYFDDQEISYLYLNTIGVRKEVPSNDASAGAATINAMRQRCATWFAAMESGAPGPPFQPVQVQPRQPADGGVQTLAQFVENRVIPNSPLARPATTLAALAGVENTAKCQGVEQITCGAIRAEFVTPEALARTFQINGPGNQRVRQVTRL